MCDSGVFRELKRKCDEETLLLSEVYEDAMSNNPDVQFSNIQSKYDHTQIAFADFFSLTFSLSHAILPADSPKFTQPSFYHESNTLLTRWSSLPNYNAFLVASDQHTYLGLDLVFTATPAGKRDACKTTDSGQRMIDFLAAAQADTHWQCWDLTAKNATEYGLDWCDPTLPYVLVECD